MVMRINELTITRPDDWHLHLRDGEAMKAVLEHTALRFGTAVVMPNLKKPIVTVDLAYAYGKRITDTLASLETYGHGTRRFNFTPLMTLYLTDNTSPNEISKAKTSGGIIAVKYYPAGATTGSDSGVTAIEKAYHVLERMSRLGMPLLIHGEVTDPTVDVFDREKEFIDRVLRKLIRKFPELKIVLEHITTKQGVQFVESAPKNVAATITAHHLLLNRNAIFTDGITGGIRPHHYCLPVLKREMHRLALVKAATSGNPKFFLGTDSAPHARHTKENDCGCAGVYTAHAGIELYVEAFEAANALDKIEAFASFHGADFYDLPRNQSKITLVRKDWVPPEEGYPFGEGQALIPFRAGKPVHWKLEL